jgi:hypothetical protein
MLLQHRLLLLLLLLLGYLVMGQWGSRQQQEQQEEEVVWPVATLWSHHQCVLLLPWQQQGRWPYQQSFIHPQHASSCRSCCPCMCIVGHTQLLVLVLVLLVVVVVILMWL